eukprot:982898-Pyramimonas_sp.AAC.1
MNRGFFAACEGHLRKRPVATKRGRRSAAIGLAPSFTWLASFTVDHGSRRRSEIEILARRD